VAPRESDGLPSAAEQFVVVVESALGLIYQPPLDHGADDSGAYDRGAYGSGAYDRGGHAAGGYDRGERARAAA
jgi:hypothetical protein